MTLQTQHTVNAPATLTDEQRQRVSDALENAQSVNTRRNYAGQLRQFQSWCHQENYSALPAQSEVVAAYVAELADEGKSMSTIRLAVAAIVDVHRRVGLESPQTCRRQRDHAGPVKTSRRQPEAGETAGCGRPGGNQGDGAQSQKVEGRLA